MEMEEKAPVSGPGREGGDLRFRRSNLFALHNVKGDASLMVEGGFAALGACFFWFCSLLLCFYTEKPERPVGVLCVGLGVRCGCLCVWSQGR